MPDYQPLSCNLQTNFINFCLKLDAGARRCLFYFRKTFFNDTLSKHTWSFLMTLLLFDFTLFLWYQESVFWRCQFQNHMSLEVVAERELAALPNTSTQKTRRTYFFHPFRSRHQFWHGLLQHRSSDLRRGKCCLGPCGGASVVHPSSSSISILYLSYFASLWQWCITLSGTLPKTNIAPTNGRLEYYFPIGEAYFQGLR